MFTVTSGSFVHDVDLKLPNWKPTQVSLQLYQQRI